MAKYINSSEYGNDLTITFEQAEMMSHQGDCYEDVKEASQIPEIKEQTDKWDAEKLKQELSVCGAWDETQLQDHEENIIRWLWISAGTILEDLRTK